MSKGGDCEIFNNGNAQKCDAPRTETPVSWSWRGEGATPSSGGSLPPAESAGLIIMQTVQFVCLFPSVHITRNSRPGPTVNLDGPEIEEGCFNPER